MASPEKICVTGSNVGVDIDSHAFLLLKKFAADSYERVPSFQGNSARSGAVHSD
ncbi:MAG: hypothetical protein ACP5O0_04000 [Acidimicrobiales bacterium]